MSACNGGAMAMPGACYQAQSVRSARPPRKLFPTWSRSTNWRTLPAAPTARARAACAFVLPSDERLRGTPVFQSAPSTLAALCLADFTIAGTTIISVVSRAMMRLGTVQPGPRTHPPSPLSTSHSTAERNGRIGGQVTWTNNGPSQHSIVERVATACPPSANNGTLVRWQHPPSRACWQRIRCTSSISISGWLAQRSYARTRWQFANETIDERSIGPAESFIVETRHRGAAASRLRALQHPTRVPRSTFARRLPSPLSRRDAHDARAGCAPPLSTDGYLTAKRCRILRPSRTPIDPGTIPARSAARPLRERGRRRWDELPGLPEITFMHAVLLRTQTASLLGYGQRRTIAALGSGDWLYTRRRISDRDPWRREYLSGAHAHLATLLERSSSTWLHDRRGVSANTSAVPSFSTPPPAPSPCIRFAHWPLLPDHDHACRRQRADPLGEDHANASGAASSRSRSLPLAVRSVERAQICPVQLFYYRGRSAPGGDLFVAGAEARTAL